MLLNSGFSLYRRLFIIIYLSNPNFIYIYIFFFKNIIHSSGPIGDEMAHYLYVLQSVCLNHLEGRMRTALDSFSQVSWLAVQDLILIHMSHIHTV